MSQEMKTANCECGLKIWMKDGHWRDSEDDTRDGQHIHHPEPSMTPIPPIPEDLKPILAAIDSFAHHSPAVCECDLEGGDPDCKIEPKCPTPYEWQCMTSAAKLRELIERIAKLTAEVERLTAKCSKMKGSDVEASDES